jgi:hypothetical protein
VIDNPGGCDLRWTGLNPKGTPPIQSLSELPPDSDGVIHFSIHHVPLSALPPHGGTLSEAEIQEHFRANYRLFGVENPDKDWLPRLDAVNMVNCVGTRAMLAPGG